MTLRGRCSGTRAACRTAGSTGRRTVRSRRKRNRDTVRTTRKTACSPPHIHQALTAATSTCTAIIECPSPCMASCGDSGMPCSGERTGPPPYAIWPRANAVCNTAWVPAVSNPTTTAPRSRLAKHHAPAAAPATAATTMCHGSGEPDDRTCPRAVSSTQTVANTTARKPLRTHPDSMSGPACTPLAPSDPGVRKVLNP